MKIWLEQIHLDLKVNWKLSRNQTTFKKNYLVHLETHLGKFRSEIAPNIRYGETVDNIAEQFNHWLAQVEISSISLENLDEKLASLQFHSLRFGVESALLSYFAKKENKSLTQFLNLAQPVAAPTSFTMPIVPINEIKDYLQPISRFSSLKIKVDAQSAKEMLLEIKKHTQVKLRVDGNEAWRDLDEFMRFQESIQGMNIELIEQPFPATMQAEYRELKKLTPYVLLADESIEDVGDFSELSKQFHAVNIKLMKTGSLIKAYKLLQEAKQYQMKAMMGCMIETTIGISYGMLFSGMVDYVDLDGFLLIKDEPFHLVSETEGILKLN
ncbi:MAG: enolase C-terminal domain-like protein [Bacteriovoracaceae bacterium]